MPLQQETDAFGYALPIWRWGWEYLLYGLAMPESMLQTIIFCIWETVSWFCNARQRTLHLQNGIKQGEQGGSVLNLFGFFLEKCVLNINLGGAVMNHCIRESHKFRSP